MKGIGKLKGQYQMDNSVKHHNFVAQHSLTVKSKRICRKSSDVNSLSVPIPKPLSEFLSSVSFKMSILNSYPSDIRETNQRLIHYSTHNKINPFEMFSAKI